MESYYAGFIPYEGKVSVIFQDVSGCTTWGESMEHVFAMAIDALAGHLEALANDGDPIPNPSGYTGAWDALRAEYAGYTTLDLCRRERWCILCLLRSWICAPSR